MNIIRVLSLSLSLILGEARADDGPYLNCHDDTDCGPEYKCVGHKYGTCEPSADPRFTLNCCSGKRLSLQCGNNSKSCAGDVAGECRKRKKPGIDEPEEIMKQVFELQQQGLIAIVCDQQKDCPPGTVCEGGHCHNEPSSRQGPNQ